MSHIYYNTNNRNDEKCALPVTIARNSDNTPMWQWNIATFCSFCLHSKACFLSFCIWLDYMLLEMIKYRFDMIHIRNVMQIDLWIVCSCVGGGGWLDSFAALPSSQGHQNWIHHTKQMESHLIINWMQSFILCRSKCSTINRARNSTAYTLKWRRYLTKSMQAIS